MKIPDRGLNKEELFEKLENYRDDDMPWRDGRTFGYIYDAGEDAENVAKQAYMMYLGENALDPTVFPSLLRFENELVAMSAAHVNGDENVVGNFTTGGTESIILAVKTARDYNRAKKPEIKQPEMILPITAHAAFHKAAHYLDVKVVQVGVDPETFRADVGLIRDAITPNTILLVGSAPSYAHGVIDPIAEIGQLALERDLLYHVDACMGGFLLPYFRRLGENVPEFDFSVPGVTSLSMDLHKYAYAAKGASIVLYKHKSIRLHQIFACASWTGYTVINNTVGSSKSGGPLAAAWAVLNYLGDEGYMELAKGKLEAVRIINKGIEQIPDLQVMGTPEMSLVCFTSDTVNVFHIIDEMKQRGWYIQPQLAFGSSKQNIHLSINASNVRWAEALVKDLAESVQKAKALPSSDLAPRIRETFSQMDPNDFTEETFNQMLGMAGMTGVELPERMAEINEVLNALPAAFREKLLIAFLNDLFVFKKNGS